MLLFIYKKNSLPTTWTVMKSLINSNVFSLREECPKLTLTVPLLGICLLQGVPLLKTTAVEHCFPSSGFWLHPWVDVTGTALDGFMSSLSDRSFFVAINLFVAFFARQTCGVPLGSVFGPFFSLHKSPAVP